MKSQKKRVNGVSLLLSVYFAILLIGYYALYYYTLKGAAFGVFILLSAAALVSLLTSISDAGIFSFSKWQ